MCIAWTAGDGRGGLRVAAVDQRGVHGRSGVHDRGVRASPPPTRDLVIDTAPFTLTLTCTLTLTLTRTHTPTLTPTLTAALTQGAWRRGRRGRPRGIGQRPAAGAGGRGSDAHDGGGVGVGGRGEGDVGGQARQCWEQVRCRGDEVDWLGRGGCARGARGSACHTHSKSLSIPFSVCTSPFSGHMEDDALRGPAGGCGVDAGIVALPGAVLAAAAGRRGAAGARAGDAADGPADGAVGGGVAGGGRGGG